MGIASINGGHEKGGESSYRHPPLTLIPQALANSVLVYNTGRSLGQFVDLMQRCGGRVAVPDVLVTAVGTKVWRLDAGTGRTRASGLEWIEDLEWAKKLDACWNLATARKVAAKLIGHYNDPGKVKVLDDGSEHQHRLALCIDGSTLKHCAKEMTDAFAKEGLEVSEFLPRGRGIEGFHP